MLGEWKLLIETSPETLEQTGPDLDLSKHHFNSRVSDLRQYREKSCWSLEAWPPGKAPAQEVPNATGGFGIYGAD
jgi:hypothetical protein